jgi:putative ABC transport system substrate-binding protein
MNRRGLITLIGDAAAWPLAVRAQQPAVRVIGFMNVGTPEGSAVLVAAFRQGLRSTSYIEKQNVAIEYCWADGQPDRRRRRRRASSSALIAVCPPLPSVL